MLIDVICFKDSKFPERCIVLPAGKKGFKVWCFKCRRYILPDKRHHVYFLNKEVCNEKKIRLGGSSRTIPDI